MHFNSLIFLVFLPLVAAVYYAMPHRHRWAVLLAASYYFYGCWRVSYLGLMVISTLIDYWAGLRMGALPGREGRKKYLWASVLSNLGLLFTFKYFNFANHTLKNVLDYFNIFYGFGGLDLLLPIGISFYTFQTMSYSIDVYRGVRPPERHLGIFAVYISFFPQLVAGPIETSTTLLPQFRQEKRFSMASLKMGLMFIMLGYYKKLVIADRLGEMARPVFDHPESYGSLQTVLAMNMYAYQVFSDFSAYSDIAIGSAMIMGYSLMNNFNRPFSSHNFHQFWQRFHVSLGIWLGRYVYRPMVKRLGGGTLRRLMPLFVFALVGLWHGANWTFVLWGTSYGVLMVFGDACGHLYKRAHMAGHIKADLLPAHISTHPAFLFVKHTLMALFIYEITAFIVPLFGAKTVADALVSMRKMLHPFDYGRGSALIVHWNKLDMLLVAVFILLLELGQWLHARKPVGERMSSAPAIISWPIIYGMLLVILMFGKFGIKQFIYYQF